MKSLHSVAKGLAVVGALLISTSVMAQCPDLQYNASVSVWDSATPAPVDGVVYPIGGSGQTNGEFTVCNGAGVQIGLRIDARSNGLITPTNNEYTAPQGDSGDGSAMWNYSGHVDFGYVYDDSGTLPNQVGDTLLAVQLDCSPYTDVVAGPLLNSEDVLPGLILPDTAQFIQLSDNLGFPARCALYDDFDPNADGHYQFTLIVYDEPSGRVLASTSAIAIVGNPTAAPEIPRVPTLSMAGMSFMILALALAGFIMVRRQG